MNLNREHQITQIICAAIAEVNDALDARLALKPSPDTILMGDGGPDSMAMVNLMAVIEEKMEQVFQEPVSVLDAISDVEAAEWTVADLARWLSQRLDRAA